MSLVLQAHIRARDKLISYVAQQYNSYETHETQYTIAVKTPTKTYVLGEFGIGLGLIKLMQRVKSDAKNAITTETKYEKMCNAKIIDYEGEIFEYDKSSAYLEAAVALNIVTPETYERLKHVTKRSRLIAIGSLATTKVIRHYQNGKQAGAAEVKRNEHNYSCWVAICNRVSREMRMHFENNDASIAYWIDALYTTSEIKIDKTFKPVQRWRGTCAYNAGLSIITKGNNVYVRVPVAA